MNAPHLDAASDNRTRSSTNDTANASWNRRPQKSFNPCRGVTSRFYNEHSENIPDNRTLATVHLYFSVLELQLHERIAAS